MVLPIQEKSCVIKFLDKQKKSLQSYFTFDDWFEFSKEKGNVVKFNEIKTSLEIKEFFASEIRITVSYYLVYEDTPSLMLKNTYKVEEL